MPRYETAQCVRFESHHLCTFRTSDWLKSGCQPKSLLASAAIADVKERFSIAFTANGKRQAEISSLPKTREIYLVSGYILPVSHSYGASTKNSEKS